ncbi:MAG: hypothetical protein E6K99_01455 [Thaumarchaeota archaeon]|nr:MAG: hypothetical protein E6K99_01455 [Nitrososphaerota archaeon]
MTSSASPSKLPLLSSIVVAALLAGALVYNYEASSSTIASEATSITSLNEQASSLSTRVSSLQGVVSSLNLNITNQISARNAVQSRLQTANATIASLSTSVNSMATQLTSLSGQVSSLQSTVSSQSSQVSSLQSTLNLQIEQTLTNNQNFNLPFNSSTTVTHFTASYAGYLQISGASNTNLAIVVCYGATSQSACDSSRTYYLIFFGQGGSTFNAPLMPGPIWINAYNKAAGTATLLVVEWI